jgi:hypothetical protein
MSKLVSKETLNKYFNEIAKTIRKTRIYDDLTNWHKLHALIDKYSLFYYTNAVGEKITIFDIIEGTTGNNIILLSCNTKNEKNTENLIYKYIDYIDLSQVNYNKENALIICIKNDMYSTAKVILDYTIYVDDIDVGIEQTDIENKNALDYMLDKLKRDENGNALLGNENKHIKDNIDIIVKIISYYLSNYKDSELIDDYVELFCKDLKFWQPLLEKKIHNERFKLTNRFCKEPKTAEISVITAKNDTRRIRGRKNYPIATIAEPDIQDIVEPQFDVSRRPRHYLPYRSNIEPLLIPKRFEPEPGPPLPPFYPPSKHTKKQRTIGGKKRSKKNYKKTVKNKRK